MKKNIKVNASVRKINKDIYLYKCPTILQDVFDNSIEVEFKIKGKLPVKENLHNENCFKMMFATNSPLNKTKSFYGYYNEKSKDISVLSTNFIDVLSLIGSAHRLTTCCNKDVNEVNCDHEKYLNDLNNIYELKLLTTITEIKNKLKSYDK